MSPADDDRLRDLAALRSVRDRIDRDYAQPLDVEALAAGVHMSAGHLSRQFKLVYGEPPYSYLMTRRIERAMALLRDHDRSVTNIAVAVGYDSLGTFSRTFREITGSSPSEYRETEPLAAPGCVVRRWTRPSSFGEAPPTPRP